MPTNPLFLLIIAVSEGKNISFSSAGSARNRRLIIQRGIRPWPKQLITSSNGLLTGGHLLQCLVCTGYGKLADFIEADVDHRLVGHKLVFQEGEVSFLCSAQE